MFTRRKCWLYLARFMHVYCYAAALASFFTDKMWPAISAIAALAASAAIADRIYRCSHCGGRLLASWDLLSEYCPERCPGCGWEVQLGWKRLSRPTAPNCTVIRVPRRDIRAGRYMAAAGLALALPDLFLKNGVLLLTGLSISMLGGLIIDHRFLCPRCKRSLTSGRLWALFVFHPKKPRHCPSCELDIFIELE